MKRILSIFLSVAFIFLFVSCDKAGTINEAGDSIPGKEALSTVLFEKIMEKNGYTVDDHTESFNVYYDEDGNEKVDETLKAYYIATGNEVNINFEFMAFDTPETALSKYVSIVSNYDSEVSDVNSIVDYANEGYTKCIFKEDKYRSVTRVENTVIMVATNLDNALEAQKLLADIGY